MFANRWYRKLLLLAIVLSAVGGACLSTASAGDAFSRKVAILKDELRGYDSLTRPGARQKAYSKINDALLAVLNEKDSLDSEPDGLTGDGGGFALTFGSWVTVAGQDHRLVFLTPKKAAAGTAATIYSQTRNGGAVSAERLHPLAREADSGRLEHAGIILSDAGCFLVLIESHRGPERNSIAFYSWRLAAGKWQPFPLPPDVTAPGRWTIDKTVRGFSIGHAAVGRHSPYDCRLNTADWAFAVELVDKDARPLAAIRLELDDGKWVIQ